MMNRRSFLSGLALMASTPRVLATSGIPAMGLSQASCRARSRSGNHSKSYPRFRDAIDFLEYGNDLGASAVQVGVRGWSMEFAGKVRKRKEILGVGLEGQIKLPDGRKDLKQFEAEVRAAKEAGARILRTVCLGGRRYETFKTLEEWLEFRRWAVRTVQLVEPIMKRHGLKLAVENHKDWRIDEMLWLLGHLSSEWVGVNLDTGNNIALLEDPHEVVEALAPFVKSVHLKDMGVQECDEGFLLAEVPLGRGFLNLPRMISIVQKANPRAVFHLEMISRDPLTVPCLSPRYWASSPGVEARRLAATLATVRRHQEWRNLPKVSSMSDAEALAFEEQNIRQSFDYSRTHLGFF